MAASSEPLPELASVYWRPRVDARGLARRERLWAAYTIAHVVPFVGTAVVLMLLQPLAFPLAAVCAAHAVIIPALYASRGANVVRRKGAGGEKAEQRALGLLGDLIGHDARELHGRTGLVLERGALGVWLVGTAGALLVRPGGRRADCWCVRVPDPEIPAGDRTAHLLLALRADEGGFATVANLAFSGALRRVRRRVPAPMRPALDAAASAAR